MAKRAKRVSAIEGSKPSEMPGFIKPQLATHEIKFDGYGSKST